MKTVYTTTMMEYFVFVPRLYDDFIVLFTQINKGKKYG